VVGWGNPSFGAEVLFAWCVEEDGWWFGVSVRPRVDVRVESFLKVGHFMSRHGSTKFGEDIFCYKCNRLT